MCAWNQRPRPAGRPGTSCHCGGSHNRKWGLGRFRVWALNSPTTSPTSRHVRRYSSAASSHLTPPPLLTDWTLRAQPLWSGTPHCHCCLTLDSLITSSMLRPGAITTVWSGLENVFWTTNKVSPTTFPLPSRTGWVRISGSSLWSRCIASHWLNFYIYIFSIHAVTLVYINFLLRNSFSVGFHTLSHVANFLRSSVFTGFDFFSVSA